MVPQTLLCTDTRTYIEDVNDNDDEDLKTFYSQYIKSENPQEKNRMQSKYFKIKKLFSLFNFFSHVHYHLIGDWFQQLIQLII